MSSPSPVHMARVVVTGSESTGKTTLATEVAAALGTQWVAEFARGYARQAQHDLTAADVEPIARGQRAAEELAIAAWHDAFDGTASPPPLILDTDLVSTTVYAEHYYGHCPPWILAEARARLGDLYLLCEPDLPWEADGVRDRPAERHELHIAFRARLREFGARVAPVSGSGPARLGTALAAVRMARALLDGSSRA
ncbi:MAG: ATP-binding protein [Gemmatimonadota bacterium]